MAFSGGTEISQVSIIYVQRLTKLLRVGNSVILFVNSTFSYILYIYIYKMYENLLLTKKITLLYIYIYMCVCVCVCVCVHTFKCL